MERQPDVTIINVIDAAAIRSLATLLHAGAGADAAPCSRLLTAGRLAG
jgi:hypothetical protein